MSPPFFDSFYLNPYALPVLIVSILIPLTGFYIYIQNKKSMVNLSFFLLCLAIHLWLLGQTGVYCAKDSSLALSIYRRVTFLGVVFISPLVYLFSTIWLNLHSENKWFIKLSFFGAVFFYILGLFSNNSFPGVTKYFWGFYPVYGPYNYAFLIFFFSYFFAAFYNFISSFRRETQTIRLAQIRFITVAFLVSFLSSFDYLPKIIRFEVYPLGFLCVFFWILVVAYAIIRYKAMNIETVIHKTIMWFVSTIVAVLPFALLIHFTQTWTRQVTSGIATVYLLLLLVGFYFYFRFIQPRLNYVFRRRSANLESAFGRFSADLVHLKNLRELLQSFARLLRRTLYTRQVSIYLKSQSEELLVPAIAKRVRGLKPIPSSHPFFQWLERQDSVVVADLVQGDPQVQNFKNEIIDYFTKTEAVITVPLVLGDKLIGVVNLGKKENLKRYSSEEIRFLSRLKSSVTIAFSNSIQFIQMQENLQKWNDELEKKVDERTKQLQETQAQLVQAEKLATIGTLAGGVAHEINNPLTAVLTNAQILKMDALPDKLESVSLIEEGAKRCQAIIQKLMKYARKSQELDIHEKVNLNKVVADTAAFLKYQLYQDNIRLVTEENAPMESIEGNANELEQVVTNLILNAKDAIQQTGHEGEIVVQTFQKNGSLGFKVKDNGIGIPKENLAKIFDPFFTTKEVGKGTGLGLAISYGIVQKHQGKIDVSSEFGEGSIFTITFRKDLS